ncbi:MAG: diaminopimelate epimerase [Gemmatimonadota bacterium]
MQVAKLHGLLVGRSGRHTLNLADRDLPVNDVMRYHPPSMSDLPFTKGQALGNDYIVIDSADLGGEPSASLVRALCDRHFGVGSDGVLLADLGRDGSFGLRIFNPDGTEAEKSGNGLRIFGAYLHLLGRVGREPFEVRLPGETVRMQVEGVEPGGVVSIVVDMGRASFRGEDVGFRPEPGDAFGHVLDLGDGLTARVNPVSIGNPHCVVFVDALEREDFLRRAPRLATHPAFAAGTNVQFVRVTGPDTIEAWVWERGAGETLASGSSACAAAYAAARLGLVEARDVTVRMPGGSLGVTLEADGLVRLQGPAQIVCRGAVPEAVVRSWVKRGGAAAEIEEMR